MCSPVEYQPVGCWRSKATVAVALGGVPRGAYGQPLQDGKERRRAKVLQPVSRRWTCACGTHGVYYILDVFFLLFFLNHGLALTINVECMWPKTDTYTITVYRYWDGGWLKRSSYNQGMTAFLRSEHSGMELPP